MFDYLGERLDIGSHKGSFYLGEVTDIPYWNLGENYYCIFQNLPLAQTGMFHADGTLPGDWTLNDTEINEIKGTLTYSQFKKLLEAELIKTEHADDNDWKSSTMHLNFNTYDGHCDAYFAIGDFSIRAEGNVCNTGVGGIIYYKVKVYLTDYYSFLDHGYEIHTRFYTPTRLGVRLQTHGWLSPFNTTGTWDEEGVAVP